MGNCYTKCRKIRARSNFLYRNITILMVGLDDSGKTTISKRLVGDCTKNVLSTVGFSTIVLYHHCYKVTIYDLGGNCQIRDIWNKYFADVYGVIFVVDSSDMNRLIETKQNFKRVVCDEKISGKPVLILGNKQDKEHVLDELDIIDQLDVERIVNEQRCPTRVETCSASNENSIKLDTGIQNGYQWLINTIIQNYQLLNDRVTIDTTQQALEVEKDKEEWRRKRTAIQNSETLEDISPASTNSPFKPINTILENREKILFKTNGTIRNGDAFNSPLKNGYCVHEVETINNNIETSTILSLKQNKKSKSKPLFKSRHRENSKTLFYKHGRKLKFKRHNKTAPIGHRVSVDNFKKSNVNTFEGNVTPGNLSVFSACSSKTRKSSLLTKDILRIRPSTAPSKFNTGSAWGLAQPLDIVEPNPFHPENKNTEDGLVSSSSENVYNIM